MRRTVRNSILGVALLGSLAAAAVPAAASGGPTYGSGGGRGCAEKFDHAQREDMESFRDFDEATWLAGHDRRAVSITATGARFEGLPAITAATRSHFANREAVWSWTEVNREIFDCRTAFIEYVAVYELPRINFYQRAHTVVTYRYVHGRWLSVLDQGTLLELRDGTSG